MKILQRLLVTLLLSLGLWGSAAAIAQTVTYFHNDISGSPLAATDEAGEVLWKEQYSPYGDKIERALAANSNRIGYHGQAHDDHSGLSYMGARYYDPVLGRFMGIDPVGFVETNLHSANRYAYANNNPYKFVDPDGRHPVVFAVVGVVAWLGTEVFFPPAVNPDAPDAIAPTTLPFDPSIAAKGVGVAVGVAGVLKSQGARVGVKNLSELGMEAQRGIRSLEKQIVAHEKKLADFKSNPTVRPGMESLPREVIEKQQQSRIQHLEKEIETFKGNIQKIMNGE